MTLSDLGHRGAPTSQAKRLGAIAASLCCRPTMSHCIRSPSAITLDVAAYIRDRGHQHLHG
jgi:hypothetical protein